MSDEIACANTENNNNMRCKMDEQTRLYFEKRLAEIEHRLYESTIKPEQLEATLQLMQKYGLQSLNIGSLRLEMRYQPASLVGQ